ncbi:hypothetical protein L596_019376 [Steinernema carpocapsae]|uniref:UDP-glucuronosyltransferase n=1 Tax=Steinernema carpocapsae TaxID=34508 RepID=A0A4U5MQF0_STECR|nr:hypothetical protein L596_019376 [Steinernema carpocapsae]
MVGYVRAQILLLLGLLCFGKARRLKILIHNPTLGHSHLHFNGAIADALVDAGHTVHLFVPDWFPGITTNGSIKAHKITRFSPSRSPKIRQAKFIEYPFQYNELDFGDFANTTVQFCEDMISDKSLIAELTSEHYDVAITEFFDYCMPGIFEVIGAKAKIFTEATPMMPMLTINWGIPSFLSYIPDPTKAPLSTPRLGYFDRARNLLRNLLQRYLTWKFLEKTTQRFRGIYGEKFPHIAQIVQNVSYAFINSIDALDLPRPISHKIVNIGGINIKAPITELPKDVREIFFLAKKGVILFSLGSIVNTTLMPDAQKSAFIEAFRQFPDYEFVWKVDQTDILYKMFRNYSNVHTIDWIDQTTLLAHPKLKLFMSHCGLNSLTEAAYSGTPILSIPIFADQQYNAAIVKQQGIGETLEFDKITTEVLVDTLRKLLSYPRYQKKADQLKKKLLTHPRGNPKEVVVKYVEYAAENSDLTNLNLLSANMDFVTLNCLDIIVPAVVIAVLMAAGVLRLLALVLRWSLRGRGSDGYEKRKPE